MDKLDKWLNREITLKYSEIIDYILTFIIIILLIVNILPYFV